MNELTLNDYVDRINDADLNINQFYNGLTKVRIYNDHELSMKCLHTLINFLIDKNVYVNGVINDNNDPIIRYLYYYDSFYNVNPLIVDDTKHECDEFIRKLFISVPAYLDEYISKLVFRFTHNSMYNTETINIIRKYLESENNLKYILMAYGDKVNYHYFIFYDLNEISINAFLNSIKYLPITFVGEYTKLHYKKIIANITEENKLILLNKIIETNELELFKIMLRDFEIEPTNKHLNIACDCKSELIIEYFLDHKFIPSEEMFNKLINPASDYPPKNVKINKCLEVLIKYNYKITYDNVLKSCKNGLIIPEFEKYDVLVDSKIFSSWCLNIGIKYANQKIPNYIKQFKPTISDLQEFCKLKLTLQNIIVYSRLSKLKLDTTCLP
jgi:hypothetical protein